MQHSMNHTLNGDRKLRQCTKAKKVGECGRVVPRGGPGDSSNGEGEDVLGPVRIITGLKHAVHGVLITDVHTIKSPLHVGARDSHHPSLHH